MTSPPFVAQRFQAFGESIFAEMTRLATRHGAVNLSQGFPDFDGPTIAKQAAIAAIESGHNQYSRMIGVVPLGQSIAQRWHAQTGQQVDPESEITVTAGCSEALGAAIMGLVNPGDEIVTFEPAFDFYAACAAMAGAVLRTVALHPPADARGSFWFDDQELRAAFSRRTRLVLLNTPHNPTGKVFTREELERIAALAIEHDAIVVTDEVYEHLTYDPALPHLHLASFPGMRERTMTLSSLGKTFSLTGWKIGWAIAPPPLSAAIRAAHQFMTFCTATPLQHGAAAALASPGTYAAELRELYVANRDTLSLALRDTGWSVHPSHATYFLMADHSALGFADDREACRWLTTEVGVAAIPPSVFYTRKELGRTLVRFAFCKKRETIEEACRRLRAKPRARRG